MEISKEERLLAIKNIVKLYEDELSDSIITSDKFQTERLPEVIQKAIKLVIAKSPGFSNISATTTVNYVFMHLVSQLRPKINDITYSPDVLGINYYGINLAPSGNGKDASLNTMKSACKTAFDLIIKERQDQEVARAKRIALKQMQADNPNLTEDELTFNDYEEFIRDLPAITAESKSTRGGIVNIITRLQNQQYGNLGVVSNEFGLALKQNNTIEELLETLGSLYDQGVTEVQAFKTVEVREQAIESQYPNTLMHSSPKIVFGNEKVRDAISNLFHTMLARRCWFTMPTEEEITENNIVPKTIKEVRDLANARRVDVSKYSSEIDNLSAEVVRTLLVSEENRTVAFSEDAKILYTDYFEMNRAKAELAEDSSIQQVELNGRAFKTARLAALWSLMSNTNEISYEMLKSAIYFAQYNSRYLDRFIALTTAKSWKLLGDLFKEEKLETITLDTAIMKGYIHRISKDFSELLEPMNSYLRGHGIATYDSDSKQFRYAPFKKVEKPGDYSISYSKVPGMSKDDRTKHLAGFELYKGMSMGQLVKLVSTDTIFSTFKYKDGDNKHGDTVKMRRSRDTIDSSTKLLVIDVDDSDTPIAQMHEYLKEFKHIIATTSNVDNKHRFRILLPINVEIEGTDSLMYKCIVKNVCEQLLVKYDPASMTNIQAFYGFDGAQVFTTEEGDLFDVTDIVSDCINNKEAGIPKIDIPKTPAAQKKQIDSVMANANKVFSYVIDCPKGTGSLSMARASLHMKDLGFTKDQYVQVINYLNSCWQNSMDSNRLDGIKNQYINEMN